MTPEAKYKASLMRRLKKKFPGCVILKNDSAYHQGVPDWTILYGPCWAMLEVKPEASAARRPNQKYFVQQLDHMSFAAFICPENEGDVLDELQAAFEDCGRTCISQS